MLREMLYSASIYNRFMGFWYKRMVESVKNEKEIVLDTQGGREKKFYPDNIKRYKKPRRNYRG